MPLLRKKEFQKKTPPEGLQDDDEVFYCELTDEVFIEYEDFCERIIQCNSLVWACSMTGKSELTFTEAVDSENAAQRMLDNFPEELKIPALYLASIVQKSVFEHIVDDVFVYIKYRYFIGEFLEVHQSDGNAWCVCEIKRVFEPTAEDISKYSSASKPSRDRFFPPGGSYSYEIEKFVQGDDSTTVQLKAHSSELRRKPRVFSKEALRLFLKQYAVLDSRGIWVIQGTVLQNFGIHKVKFHDLFLGNPPSFPSTPKKQKSPQKSSVTAAGSSSTSSPKTKKTKKSRQENIEKYLVPRKDDGTQKKKSSSQIAGVSTSKKSQKSDLLESSASRKQKIKNTEAGRKKDILKQKGRTGDKGDKVKEDKKQKESEEKLKKHEEKLREKAKQKEEKLQLQKFFKEWNRQREDLECEDLKDLPAPQPVMCQIPNENFGEFIMILEFLHSFSKELNIKSFFPSGMSFDLLERALTEQEIAGPLVDIIQMLLCALFKLQEDEDDEINLRRIPADLDVDDTDMTTSEAVRQATAAAGWCKHYQGMPLSEVTLNPVTLTEVLRLHFLSSGGRARDTSSKWKYQQRGGYDNGDDPGLELRIKQPHILRALNSSTVCELPFEDKLTVLSCLMNQVLTYATLREEIEERADQTRQIKSEVRSFQVAEIKREKEAAAKRIKEKKEARLKQITGETSSPTEEQMGVSEAEKTKIEKEMSRKKSEAQKKASKIMPMAMTHQLLPLGTDRAHRRFWLFSCLPGLFVEQDSRFSGPCLPKPTPHNPLARGDTLTYVRRLFEEETQTGGSDKENDGSEVDMSRPVTNQNKKMLGEKNIPAAEEKESWPEEKLSQLTEENEKPQTEIWECTSSDDCPVHHSSTIKWSFFAEEADVTMLLDSLNQRGIRESDLRSVLLLEEQRIKESISQCPLQKPNKVSSQREQRKSTRLSSSQKQEYANLNYPAGTPIPAIMEQALRDFILDLESKINAGCLGSLNVTNRDKWRDAIQNNGYDQQCEKLIWGLSKDDDSSDDEEEGEEEEEDGEKKKLSRDNEMEMNTSFDKSSNRSCTPVSLGSYPCSIFDNTQELVNPTVRNLASAILQLGQSVDVKYLKKPLIRSQASHTKSQIQRWEVSLMASSSFSQLFLHISTLDRSVQWSRSALNARCCLCRRRGDAENMLLCDGCNKGHHMYCLKPKLTVIPSGDWYCKACTDAGIGDEAKSPRALRKRKPLRDESGEEEEAPKPKERKTRSNNEVCNVCGLANDLINCSACSAAYHSVCFDPPLKVPVKSGWMCKDCVKKESRRAKDAAPKEDIPKERQRRVCTTATRAKIARFAKRLRTQSWDDDDKEEAQNVRRSSRRSHGNPDDLPLNNVALQDLLTDVMNHKDSWPFKQPVRKAEVPDYHIIIKRPMDFGTMKYKLNMIEYKKNSEFLQDALLIFDNCKMYNQADAEEYKCGIRLSRFFKRRCKELGLDAEDIHRRNSTS